MGSPSQSIKDQKSQVREAWKQTYPRDPQVKQKTSQQICFLLTHENTFNQARYICIFASRAWEIDLLPLFDISPRKYCFPKVNPIKKQLEFHLISSPQELQPGCFGILEPPPSSPICMLDARDLVLVPGFAFDLQGYRIGSGGGYYDRFFAAHPSIPRWGVCFTQQISKLELAHLDHDARMDAIISESGLSIAKKVE